MKKKIIIIIIPLLILSMTIGIIILKNSETSKTEPKKTKEEEISEKVEKFTKTATSEKITQEKLTQITGAKIFKEDIMLGQGTYLREKPVVPEEKIEEYLKAQDKYATNVENQIKENLEYKIEKTITSVDDIIVTTVKFKSYYYSWYLLELKQIQANLLKQIGYKIETGFGGTPTQQTKINEYKAKIKAMEILDNRLEDYKNQDEYMTFDIKYSAKDKDENRNSIMQYYSNLKGDYYPSTNIYTEEFQKMASNRVEEIIKKAKQDGTLNSKDPLKLK
ncbi:MAG: hypothetical protein HFH46_01615 [Bacilli bacterium]|nr:hypothetical protein [Bacilli bacterium]